MRKAETRMEGRGTGLQGCTLVTEVILLCPRPPPQAAGGWPACPPLGFLPCPRRAVGWPWAAAASRQLDVISS